MGRLAVLKIAAAATAAALLASACGSGAASRRSSPAPTAPPPAVSPSPSPSPSGPGGLSLADEVGAVIMSGFQGPPTASVLADWRAHQFGGLLVIPNNGNASSPAGTGAVIASVRAVMRRRLIAATDQEGGGVCMLPSPSACLSWAKDAGALGPAQVGRQMRQMACALRGAGFDEDLAPVADVWDGSHPFMAERSYGTAPSAVAADVKAAVAAIHACGLLSTAKHFPGEGAAAGDPHIGLAVSEESAATFAARDWVPFRAAIGAQVDMVMVGHVLAPALDPADIASTSPVVISDLRSLGFQGVAISDDMEMGALKGRYTVTEAAVRFLESDGDMVMIAHDLAVADAVYTAIMRAVLDGTYPRSRLDASVARILALRPA